MSSEQIYLAVHIFLMLKTWVRLSISQHNLKISPRTNVQTLFNSKLRGYFDECKHNYYPSNQTQS
jgi:hypothetical protein